MDKSAELILYSSTSAQDEFGVFHETETSKKVYCQVQSVTQSEFFEGGRNGLNPEYKFTMFFGDYNGERTVGYNGLKYAVYRTFQAKNDNIELYVQREGGTNGTVNSGYVSQ